MSGAIILSAMLRPVRLSVIAGQINIISSLPLKDQKLKDIIKEVIGSKKIGRLTVVQLVKKKHPEIGQSKIRRVYEKEGLSLTKRWKKRIKDNPANPIGIPFDQNEEWAIDFMSDCLENGRRFWALNIIDHYNRVCKGIYIAFNLPASVVIKKLEQAIGLYGKPKRIRTDNGPEFISKKFQVWLDDNKIQWSPIQKGKPQQNAVIERFNRTYRENILDARLFRSISGVEPITQEWVKDYNYERPHQSLLNKTPMEYAAAYGFFRNSPSKM